MITSCPLSQCASVNNCTQHFLLNQMTYLVLFLISNKCCICLFVVYYFHNKNSLVLFSCTTFALRFKMSHSLLHKIVSRLSVHVALCIQCYTCITYEHSLFVSPFICRNVLGFCLWANSLCKHRNFLLSLSLYIYSM